MNEPKANHPSAFGKVKCSACGFDADVSLEIAGALEISKLWIEGRPVKFANARGVVLDEIHSERQRQIEEKGHNENCDDLYRVPELAAAASAYAWPVFISQGEPEQGNKIMPWQWPWDEETYKPRSPRRNLVRAAALIVAEIERLDRLALKRPR